MADPTKYEVDYNFANYQSSNPTDPLPATDLDNELANIETSIDEIVDAIKDVRRSDGALKNGIVTMDALSPEVAGNLGESALENAEAAADSAAEALVSAEAAAESETLAGSHADEAEDWATTAYSVTVPGGGGEYSALHYATQASYWANRAEDSTVPGGSGEFSAKHYAAKAAASAGSLDQFQNVMNAQIFS